MAGSIIEVKNISKRFILNHEGGERYTALRDVVAQKLKKTFSFPASLRGTQESKEEFWALKDVSFNVEQGDRVGIIGRNGAGKSTLLKILSRITEPTSGEIRIKGRVASLLEVGTGFHPELTGRENIFLNGAILGMSRAEIKRKFDEIVDFAEVEKFLDTPVKRYSSGMYVRLAFAVAAHLEPEILIVDEVLAVGDAQFQKKCLGKMQDVSDNEGRTVLFVSHNMDAIEILTKSCIYLKNGEIKSLGKTEEQVNHYLTDYETNQELSGYSNRSGTGKARVIKLELLQNNQQIQVIKQGEVFEVLIGINIETQEEIDVSIVIENHREQGLFCSQYSDNHKLIKGKKYAEFKILFNVPFLRKGNYLASVAVFKSDKTEFYDLLLHFPLLLIEGIDDEKLFPVDNRWGDLFFPLIWQKM